MNNIGRITRVLAALGMMSLAACGDRVVEPTSAPVRARTPLLSTAVGPLTVQNVVVNPWSSQAYQVGGVHGVYFQAGSICDPAVSSYGPGTWDDPCTPLTRSITLTATSWRDAEGNPYVDFQPALRFVPGKAVVLYMADPDLPSDWNPQTIFYCTDDAICVDETQADASLSTYFDAASGVYYRQVKHFSGYVISPRMALETVLETVDGAVTSSF